MEKLNTKHLMFIIWGTSIISMKTYPNIFIVNGGRDSWISVIIASILMFLYFIYIIFVCNKSNCYSMNEIYHRASEIDGEIKIAIDEINCWAKIVFKTEDIVTILGI
jgi:hypothetical protein